MSSLLRCCLAVAAGAAVGMTVASVVMSIASRLSETGFRFGVFVSLLVAATFGASVATLVAQGRRWPAVVVCGGLLAARALDGSLSPSVGPWAGALAATALGASLGLWRLRKH
jgi:hypothetical protein